jgi:hypothetical protein
VTAANQQIISAYEQLGMSPDEIAQDQDLDVAAVKSVLIQFSTVFRKDLKIDESLDFTEEQVKRATDVILHLAQYSDDENLRFRAARYIRDDKKGRLDVVQQMTGLNINVITINEQMRKALEAVNKSKEIVDVESTSVKLIGNNV